MRYKREPTRLLDLQSFGAAVQKARLKSNMTQAALAEKLGVSERLITGLETKGQHMTIQLFYEIVTELDLSVDEFFYPTKQPTASSLRMRVDRLLDGLDTNGLSIVEATAEAIRKAM